MRCYGGHSAPRAPAPIRRSLASMPASCEPEPQPRRMSLPELAALMRALRKHGLWPLRLPGVTDFERPCHGHANCCRCDECAVREARPQVAEPAPAQPWEPKPPRSRSSPVIDINTPVGAQPRDLFLAVYTAIFDEAIDADARSERPPQLEPSITLARAAQARDDVDELDRQLRNVARAAAASIVRIRAAAS